MVFRVLEYVLQIYKRQLRDWQPEYGSLDEFHFQPVLPVVLYSGTRAWDRLAGFAELLEADEDLAGLTPAFLPLFLNVSQASAATLETQGGAFGLLLRLVHSAGYGEPSSRRRCGRSCGPWRSNWRRRTVPAGWNCFRTCRP
jgi:hypothetical protein